MNDATKIIVLIAILISLALINFGAVVFFGCLIINKLNEQEKLMTEDFTKLDADEAAEESAIDAAITDIKTLATELAAAKAAGNQADIDRLDAAINAKTAALKAAVAPPTPPATT